MTEKSLIRILLIEKKARLSAMRLYVFNKGLQLECAILEEVIEALESALKK